MSTIEDLLLDEKFDHLTLKCQELCIARFLEKVSLMYGIPMKELKVLVDKAQRCISCGNKYQCVCKGIV